MNDLEEKIREILIDYGSGIFTVNYDVGDNEIEYETKEAVQSIKELLAQKDKEHVEETTYTRQEVQELLDTQRSILQVKQVEQKHKEVK